MKLYIGSVFIGAVLFSGCTSVHQMNPTPDQQISTKTSMAEDEFNKERLVQEAYNKGVREGISRGHDQAVSIITKEYLPYIKRLEAGKYAVRKGYITPPEVMVLQGSDGTLSYRTTGCKIEKELDVNDIFKKFGSSVVISNSTAMVVNEKNANENFVDESYRISYRDSVAIPTMRPGSQSEIMTKNISKTATNKLVLDEYNIHYSELDGVYIASFATKEEMEGFCGQFRICSKDY
jgi:hypothetical protein